MFVLVESLVQKNLAARPDLGCAMVIAACRESNVETTLVKGQTAWLKNMFLDDS